MGARHRCPLAAMIDRVGVTGEGEKVPVTYPALHRCKPAKGAVVEATGVSQSLPRRAFSRSSRATCIAGGRRKNGPLVRASRW